MKYLKIYEEFAKKKYLNIKDYDWQYFLQDFIDILGTENIVENDGLQNFDKNGFIKFHIAVFNKPIVKKGSRKKNSVRVNLFYETGAEKNYMNFDKIEDLKGPIEVIINRVEVLGGKIIIESCESSTKGYLDFMISANVFQKIN